MKCRIPTGITG